MKTLLFATGESTKLAPLSNHIVTPMMPILNRPVMDYNLEMLGKQNIKEINISLLNKPAEIEGHFGDGRHRGLNLTYHLQREAWGDAGAIRWAFNAAEDTILFLPADILIDLHIEPLLEFHRRHANGVTAVVTRSQETQPRLTRPFLFQPTDHASSLNNRFNDGNEYTGVYLIAPEIIQKIPYKQPFTILSDLLPLLVKECIPVFTYEFTGFWNALKTFSQFRSAQIRLCAENHSGEGDRQSLKFITRQGRQVWKGVWIGKNNLIHPSARIASVFYSNDNNRIGKDVLIGPDVILGRNIIIDEEATLNDAIVLDHTYIGRLMNVQSKIIYKNLVIDIQTGEHIAIRDEFMLAENEEKQFDWGLRRFASSVAALLFLIALLPLLLLVSLYLGLLGTKVFTTQECMHSDFRWFIPSQNRKLKKFKLFSFQTRRKNHTYVPLGKFLEKTRIADLPQLINIIKGELAFVGVKPLETNQVNELTEAWQKNRYSVPVGITGLWYLRAGPDPSLEQTLIADTYYAAMRNWKEDLKILIQTPKALFEKIQHI